MPPEKLGKKATWKSNFGQGKLLAKIRPVIEKKRPVRVPDSDVPAEGGIRTPDEFNRCLPRRYEQKLECPTFGEALFRLGNSCYLVSTYRFVFFFTLDQGRHQRLRVGVGAWLPLEYLWKVNNNKFIIKL